MRLCLLALALCAATPAAAQLLPEGAGVVNTNATATARLPATVAELHLAVTVSAATVADATTQLAQRTQRLIAYLQEQHADRLRTEGTTLEPQTQPVPHAADKVVGYSGETVVSLRLPPDAAGTIMAGALAHGADALRGIAFLPREEEIAQARRGLAVQATKDALAEAAAVAEAAGEHVTQLRSVTVNAGQPPRPPFMALRAAAPAAIPTVPGDEAVSVTVQVQVQIAR